MGSARVFGKKLLELKRSLAEGLLTPLRQMLPDDRVQAVLDACGCRFRERLYTPLVTFWALLSQVLSPDKSCRSIVTRLLSGVIGAGGSSPSENTGAYCRARRRLPEEALKKLICETAAGVEVGSRASGKWQGRRIVLVDGTSVSMPENRALVDEFGRAPNQNKRGFPVARLVALISLTAGVVIDAAMGRFRTHERELYRQIWGSLRRGDVVVGDRGFGSYSEIAILKERGVDGVFRMNARRNVNLRGAEKLGDEDYLVTWKVPNHLPVWLPDDLILPETLAVRVIRIRPRIPGFRVRQIVLATSLLDPLQFPKDEIVALYRARWTVEIDLRHIKSSLGMDVLRGLSPEIVRREVWAHLLAYNLISSTMSDAAEQHEVDFARLSFKGTMSRIDAFTRTMNSAPTCELYALYDDLLLRVARDRVPLRLNRFEPRALKRHRTGFAYLTVTREKARGDLRRGWRA